MMDNLIFPMKTIGITQKYSSTHCAWDLGGENGTTKEYWRAPCHVKVLKMLSYSNTGFANTVIFGTCDSSGNRAAVKCADGNTHVLSFACTHMDSLDRFELAEGKIYSPGEICYQEGTTGRVTGPHVHMEVAEGWHYSKTQSSNGQWLIEGCSDIIERIFFALKGWTVEGNLNGYSFPYVSSRIDGKVTNVLNMYLYGSAARLRDTVVNGKIKTTVPKEANIEIIGLYSWKASDGYRWGYGKYKGVEGFFQYDPAVMYPVGSPTVEYKMHLFGSPARIRHSIQGSVITTVANGEDILAGQFISGKQSDGYQWCYGHKGQIYGYFQYDPVVMYPTND